jgi:hypothetical protein
MPSQSMEPIFMVVTREFRIRVYRSLLHMKIEIDPIRIGLVYYSHSCTHSYSFTTIVLAAVVEIYVLRHVLE